MITTSADWSEVKFNGTDIAQVNFNGVKVWKKGPAQGIYGVRAPRSEYASANGHIMTRTNDSSRFTATAYMNDGNTPGFSSFDNVMPWAGMIRTTINGNEFVAIPKFWYQIEQGSYYDYIRIANYAAPGFSVSPAHRARNGEQEKDVVYMSRYMSSDQYDSKSGSTIKTLTPRGTARTFLISAGLRQVDISMMMTIKLLYLVEYADWNSKLVVGSPYSFTNTGGTDDMPYHTGTKASTRASTNYVQYRNIELYNAFWVDGILFSGTTGYVWNNFSEYTENVNGTGRISIGNRPSSNNQYVISPGFRSWPTPETVSGKALYGAMMWPDNVSSSSTNNMGYTVGSAYSDIVVVHQNGAIMDMGALYKTSASAQQKDWIGFRAMIV